MYGGVGTGKTMLMDLFAESAPPEFQASPYYVKGWMHTHTVTLGNLLLHMHAAMMRYQSNPIAVQSD